MSESIPTKAQQYDCLNSSRIRTIDMTKEKGENPQSLSPPQWTGSKEGMLREIAFLRERHISRIPNTDVSSENIHMNHVTQARQAVFRNTHTHSHARIYTYMNVTITNERRGLEFEREQGKTYEGFWDRRKEGEWCNYILISHLKIKEKMFWFMEYNYFF